MKTLTTILITALILGTASLSFGVGTGSSGGDSGASGGGGASNLNRSRSETYYYDRGLSFVEVKDYRRAASMFRRATKIKTDYAEAYNMLGFSLRKSGKYEDAIKSYKKALELNPEFAEAHEYLGEAYLAIDEKAMALEHHAILIGLGSEEADELLEKIEEYDRLH